MGNVREYNRAFNSLYSTPTQWPSGSSGTLPTYLFRVEVSQFIIMTVG